MKKIIKKLIFLVIFCVAQGYVLRVWKRVYHKRNRMDSFIWKISSKEYNEYIKKLPQEELKEFISASAWKDTKGEFRHFEDIRSKPMYKHAFSADIKEETIRSAIKHMYPIYFVAEKFLKGYDMYEYGCGEGRNYSYTRDSVRKYTGYDINKSAIDYAKKLYPEGNFILIDKLKDVLGEPKPKSVALLSYILGHLTYKEQRELLLDCSKIHDKIVIYESLTYEHILNADNNTWEFRKINYIKQLKLFGMKLDFIMYHPIALPHNKGGWIKPNNCGMLLMFDKIKSDKITDAFTSSLY